MTFNLIAGMYLADFGTFLKFYIPKKTKRQMDNEFTGNQGSVICTYDIIHGGHQKKKKTSH